MSSYFYYSKLLMLRNRYMVTGFINNIAKALFPKNNDACGKLPIGICCLNTVLILVNKLLNHISSLDIGVPQNRLYHQKQI